MSLHGCSFSGSWSSLASTRHFLRVPANRSDASVLSPHLASSILSVPGGRILPVRCLQHSGQGYLHRGQFVCKTATRCSHSCRSRSPLAHQCVHLLRPRAIISLLHAYFGVGSIGASWAVKSSSGPTSYMTVMVTSHEPCNSGQTGNCHPPGLDWRKSGCCESKPSELSHIPLPSVLLPVSRPPSAWSYRSPLQS